MPSPVFDYDIQKNLTDPQRNCDHLYWIQFFRHLQRLIDAIDALTDAVKMQHKD